MGVKKALKGALIGHSITKRKKTHPFDAEASEHYRLPEGSAPDMSHSYYFSCFQDDGTTTFFRFAERGGNMHEIWFVWYDRAGNIFINEDKLLPADKTTVNVECVTPLKEWNFTFSGKVRRAKPDANLIAQEYGEAFPATFSGNFKCTDRLYEFSRDTSVIPYKRALSEIKWGKNFRSDLEYIHQIHTEQAGIVSGTLKTDGRELKISATGLRDHSFGRREWGYFDRHCWLIAIFPDGANFNVNMVRYPLFKELRTGYYVGGGKTLSVIDTTSMDAVPQDGRVPKTVDYETQFEDGTSVKSKAALEIGFPFTFQDGAYTIYEGVGSYDMGGKKARGVIEFGFNADKSRWTR